jgi:predicted ester cyclase
MWAQLIKGRVKPGKEDGFHRGNAEIRAVEQPGSGLIRSLHMKDQKDPSVVYTMVIFESEEKARARESDSRRQEGVQKAREVLMDTFDGPMEFVDLEVVGDFAPDGTEANVALARRVVDELANKGNLAIVDELMAANFEEHEALPPGIPAGGDGVKAIFTMLRSGFPDLHADIEEAFAQGDRVLLRMQWHGTNSGEFMGMPATGKEVSFGVIDEFRFVDGKVADHWGQLDMFNLMVQLGVIPAPAVPAG